MPKKSEHKLDGNDRYEGYSMDLIDAIARKLNFTYVFRLAADNKNGNYDEDKKEWTGIIGDVLNGVRKKIVTLQIPAVLIVESTSWNLRLDHDPSTSTSCRLQFTIHDFRYLTISLLRLDHNKCLFRY